MKKVNSKVLFFFLIAIILGLSLYLGHSVIKSTNNKTNENTTSTIEPSSEDSSKEVKVQKNHISSIGIIMKNGDKYSFEGWDLKGDIDFNEYLDIEVSLEGDLDNKEGIIEVTNITKMDNEKESPTFTITGKINYLSGGNEESPSDIHYSMDKYELRSKEDLSKYTDKKITLEVRKSSFGTTSNKQAVDVVSVKESK